MTSPTAAKVAPTSDKTRPETPPAIEGPSVISINASIFKDVHVQLQAKLGQVRMSVEELLALKAGSVVKLDLKMNEPIELRLNESLVARGEIVAVDDNFGVRIIEVAKLP
jgi:flagellar motor switch protein FliN/FliY